MYLFYTGHSSTQRLRAQTSTKAAHPASIIIIYCVGPKRLTILCIPQW